MSTLDHLHCRQELIKHLDEMKSDTVRNYVIAGLSSSLLENGVVRYFENKRDHQDQITPHTHRFDFICLVLQGHVTNRTWRGVDPLIHPEADAFAMSKLTYLDNIGEHSVERVRINYFISDDHTYFTGQVYSMRSDEFHSIQFSQDCKVLFFEGPSRANVSYIIEPWVDGEVIPTYEKKPYMFKKELV